jgi:hypothetical protein
VLFPYKVCNGWQGIKLVYQRGLATMCCYESGLTCTMKAPAVVDNFPLMKWKGLQILFPLPKLWNVYAQNEARPDVEISEGCIHGENPFLFLVPFCYQNNFVSRRQKMGHNGVMSVYKSILMLVSAFNNCGCIKSRYGEGYSGPLKLFNFHS